MSTLNIVLLVLDLVLLLALVWRHKRLSSRTRRLGLCTLYLISGYFFLQSASLHWLGWVTIGLAIVLIVAEFTPYAERLWGQRVEYPRS